MPIYEYECTACGEKFELRRSITASDSDIECPACGTTHPRRIISVFSAGTSSGSCSTGGST